MTIMDRVGTQQFLSDDVYEITQPLPLVGMPGYMVGSMVRLISGVDGIMTPGHHFDKDYCTVCRIDAPFAEFLGIKKAHLRKVES